MKIAVLSGKGGTGKTFVSVNLACSASEQNPNCKVVYADCDVEEPNGRLFLKPDNTVKEKVSVLVPEVNAAKCTACRKCIDFCRYNALAYVKDTLLVFKEICHSCEGCIIFCPQRALSKTEREIGCIEQGTSGDLMVLTGCLNTGEVSGVQIIKDLMGKLPQKGITVIDCPPGSACTVMESIKAADYCLLVAEPTIFGAQNLSMVYELVKLFDKPLGIVLNKCMSGQKNPSEEFCISRRIEIVERIPFDARLGKHNSNGILAVHRSKYYMELFQGILKNLQKRWENETAANSQR